MVAIIGLVLTVIVALVAVFFYYKQAWAATRDHLNNVHQLVFERLDAPEIRAARHYVYALDTVINSKGELEDRPPLDTTNLTYQVEHWLALGSPGFTEGTEQQQQVWKRNKAKAETVARALDQLGYLVREGIVPLNVVARFYSYPALKCWYQLSPYIGAIRSARKQPGHMWEWENLVREIINGARKGTGIWKGTLEHDNLGEYAEKIKERTSTKDFPRDEKWKPPDRSWAN
jgi:hypothetical protein